MQHMELISFIHSVIELLNHFYDETLHIQEVKNIFHLDGVYANLVKKVGLVLEQEADHILEKTFTRTKSVFSRRNTLKSPSNPSTVLNRKQTIKLQEDISLIDTISKTHRIEKFVPSSNKMAGHIFQATHRTQTSREHSAISQSNTLLPKLNISNQNSSKKIYPLDISSRTPKANFFLPSMTTEKFRKTPQNSNLMPSNTFLTKRVLKTERMKTEPSQSTITPQHIKAGDNTTYNDTKLSSIQSKLSQITKNKFIH